jgi:ElaB/YqjD/DUF883 family membrane-anchored ribosome-binding protein
MAETSRDNVDPAHVESPPGEGRAQESAAGHDLEPPELPVSAAPANNPVLNRSAEAVGRGVGTAVAGVRNLPQQIDKLRSRIHLVSGREALKSRLSEIRDSAEQVVADWRESAEDRLNGLGDEAEAYAYRMTDRANHGLENLGRQLQRRIAFLRQAARQRLTAFRAMQSKHPLRVIGSFAVAGFVAGVALRVWRSNRG